MKTVTVSASGTYQVRIGSGLLQTLPEALGQICKAKIIAIISDSNVWPLYGPQLASSMTNAGYQVVNFVFPAGEERKTAGTYLEIVNFLAENRLTRSDALIALGGGVVGDITGFAAATYLRGIAYIQVPTTLLAAVDSSVGGKTAVNFGGVKNIIGAFYQPKAVLIDPETLKTLSERHFSNGLAEAVKMSLTFDKELFGLFENCDARENIETIIEHSIRTKAAVVEKDEKESGLRKVLNFGHTIGHAIESAEELGGLYHGECVALGMIPMCSPEIRERLKTVLKKLGLPTEYQGDIEKLVAAASHDKKFSGERVTVITLPEIENFKMEEWSTAELFERMKEFFT